MSQRKKYGRAEGEVIREKDNLFFFFLYFFFFSLHTLSFYDARLRQMMMK
jgi:hypothetical protein